MGDQGVRGLRLAGHPAPRGGTADRRARIAAPWKVTRNQRVQPGHRPRGPLRSGRRIEPGSGGEIVAKVFYSA